jgi:Concanavalin A-like lectin/glucanases superfamily
MESNTNSSPVSRLVSVLLFFAGLIGIYYLYDYLFGPKAYNAYVLSEKVTQADIDVAKPITISSDKMPSLYEGGEFSVSAWIYINNWSYRQGYNKCILRIGGSSFDTIRINLGGFKPKLQVRLHTKDKSAPLSSINNSPDSIQSDSLEIQTLNAMYNVQQMEAGLLDSSTPSGCDLPEVDLQRWVNIVVAVNGKTVDVYLDGKLARSCVLPNYFKVDSSYSCYLLAHGGFGGQIGNIMMYDSALNPETIYKNYIAGPEQITGFWQWFTSFFDIGVDVTVASASNK